MYGSTQIEEFSDKSIYFWYNFVEYPNLLFSIYFQYYSSGIFILFQIAAISEQASESDEETTNLEENTTNPLGWKSFDMRSVVSATEDLLQFILSDKGQRVRVYLLRDIISAADAFLEDEVVGCMSKDRLETRGPEVCFILFYN